MGCRKLLVKISLAWDARLGSAEKSPAGKILLNTSVV
jgi:hypothetical protein